MPSNRDLAKPLIRARADRLELEAAQMGSKAIALYAYHRLQDRLTEIGRLIHENKWRQVQDKLNHLGSATDLDWNALDSAVQTASGLGGPHAS